jgi:hypothetical protein
MKKISLAGLIVEATPLPEIKQANPLLLYCANFVIDAYSDGDQWFGGNYTKEQIRNVKTFHQLKDILGDINGSGDDVANMLADALDNSQGLTRR